MYRRGVLANNDFCILIELRHIAKLKLKKKKHEWKSWTHDSKFYWWNWIFNHLGYLPWGKWDLLKAHSAEDCETMYSMVGRQVERELKCWLSQQLKLLRNGEFNHITIILTLPVNLGPLALILFRNLWI